MDRKGEKFLPLKGKEKVIKIIKFLKTFLVGVGVPPS